MYASPISCKFENDSALSCLSCLSCGGGLLEAGNGQNERAGALTIYGGYSLALRLFMADGRKTLGEYFFLTKKTTGHTVML